METVYLIILLIALFSIIHSEKNIKKKKIEETLNLIKTENSNIESLINTFNDSFSFLEKELFTQNIINPLEIENKNKNIFKPLSPSLENLIMKHNEPFEWNLLVSKNKPPSERKGQSSIIIDNYLIIFGGCDLEDNCFNDLYFFDLQKRFWEKIICEGEIPSSRQFHTANLYGNKMIIYGGNKGSDLKNDLYSFDIIKRQWKKLNYKNQLNEGRKGHNAIIDNKGRLFVFGGYTSKGYSNDIFIINLLEEKFETINVKGNVPSPRENFIFEFGNNYIYLFGGFHEGGSLNDLYKFNTENFLWESIELENYPQSKEGFSSIIIGDEIYINGGCDYKTKSCSGKTYVFNLKDQQFTEIKSKIIQPRYHSSFNFYRGNLIIFGGCEFDKKCFNDIYKMNITYICPNNCNNNGYCNEKIGCICYNNFYESDCSKKVICGNDCNNRGKCLLNGNCKCEHFYTGKNCEINLGCEKNCTSEKNGICDMKKNICICNEGFEGEYCQNEIKEKLNFYGNQNNTIQMEEQQILIQEYSKTGKNKNLKLLKDMKNSFNFIILTAIFIFVFCCYTFNFIIKQKEMKNE